MTPSSATPNVFDLSSLATLKGAVKQDDPKALKAAARQFEALFLQMVLKSMRDATPREGLFDSEQTRLYESLLDQQLAQVMSAKGGTGLAALIEKQLSRGKEGAETLGDLPLVPLPRSLRLSPAGTPLRLPGNEGTPGFPVEGIPTQPAAPGASGTAPGAAAGTRRRRCRRRRVRRGRPRSAARTGPHRGSRARPAKHHQPAATCK